MAFLDNSGDIILDAVLTDLGRERMASGEFKVKYFALGDDEIDYSLYNKTHASGSAYYDLDILQTPILEAFTRANAAINYGLLSTTATELLYMPVLKTNDNELSTAVSKKPKTSGAGTIYWLTDTSKDTTAASGEAIDDILTKQSSIGLGKYLQGDSTTYFILIESGIDTTRIRATQANTNTYINQNGLMDDFYYVYYDARFIDTVYGPTTSKNGASATFNNARGGTGQLSVSNWEAGKASSIDLGMKYFKAARIKAFKNEVFYSPSNTADDTNISSVSGPRGNATVIALSPKTDIGDGYTLYGATDSAGWTQASTGIQFIDTTVYVQGVSSGATLQLPIRIARANV